MNSGRGIADMLMITFHVYRVVRIYNYNIIPFFRLNYKCPLGFNAAEYYVSLLGIQLDKELESRERVRKICDEYQRSDIAAEIENQVADIRDELDYFNGEIDEKVSKVVVETNILD